MGIKENNKVLNGKSFIVSGDIHQKFSAHCKKSGHKISFLLEEMIVYFLENSEYAKEDVLELETNKNK